MSQLQKRQPAGQQQPKTPSLLSSVLFIVSLLLIFSPLFVVAALRKLSSRPLYEINIIALVPFVIGIVFLVVLRMKKIV